MEDIQIDLYQEQDLPALSSTYIEAYNTINIGEKWNDDKATILLRWFHKLQPDLFMVAKMNSIPIGACVAVIKPWWDGNHLIDGELFVHPQNQKQGAGKKLLAAMFDKAKKQYGALSWDTFTHTAHTFPLSWYKRIGFKEIQNWIMISGQLDQVLTSLR